MKVMAHETHEKDRRFVEPMFYTPSQIARKLNKSVDWVYAEIQAERIPAIKMGAEWRIGRDAFEGYINALNGEKDEKSPTTHAKSR